MIETVYVEPVEKIRQVFPALPGRLPVVQQRREKPGMQIDLIVFAAQDREHVEWLPAAGFVPVVEPRRLLQQQPKRVVHDGTARRSAIGRDISRRAWRSRFIVVQSTHQHLGGDHACNAASRLPSVDSWPRVARSQAISPSHLTPVRRRANASTRRRSTTHGSVVRPPSSELWQQSRCPTRAPVASALMARLAKDQVEIVKDASPMASYTSWL